MTKIIAGIDPGITVGLAILDLDGNLIAVMSRRGMGKNEIVNFITKFGQPLIVASDVNPIPKTVEKIASVLHAKAYFPERSLHVNEKEQLIKDFSGIAKEEHEVDALAASIKAWKNYRSFFLRTREKLEKLGMTEFFDDVIMKLIKGEADNIEDAATEILNQKRRLLPEIKPAKKDIEIVQKLHRALTQKDKYIENLKQQSIILSKALNKIKMELKDFEKIKWDAEKLEKMKKEIEILKKTNDLLKKLRKIEGKEVVPLIEIEGDVDELNKNIDLEERFLFSNSLENLSLLNQYKIKGLLTTSDVNKKMIKDLEFPVIQVNEELIQNIEGIKIIKIEDLLKELPKAKRTGLIEWLEEYKRRKM